VGELANGRSRAAAGRTLGAVNGAGPMTTSAVRGRRVGLRTWAPTSVRREAEDEEERERRMTGGPRLSCAYPIFYALKPNTKRGSLGTPQTNKKWLYPIIETRYGTIPSHLVSQPNAYFTVPDSVRCG